jgi:dTDP-4-amino-4,6-dideoxygalactose transaminase
VNDNIGSKSQTAISGASRIDGVPMLDLQRQYATIRTEIHAAIEHVCDTQHFINGEDVAAFEREAAAYLGCDRAIGCASGTDALWLSLQAAGVQPGDSVITTAFSFFASASSIVRAGARPIFVDVNPGTLNLDPDAVQRRIEQVHDAQLRAVLPVHLYGQCADMDAFQHIGEQHKLAVVEDAAQAFGALWNGKHAGSLGIAAAFSFYPTKNLSCYGDGGLVSTVDERVAERVSVLRNHGSRQRYYHDEIGWNSRLDSVQAAVLRVKLQHIDQWNAARRHRALTYDRMIAAAGLLNSQRPGHELTLAAPVQLLETAPAAHHIFHQYVIRARHRDRLRQFLSERGVGSEIYYPVPLHLQKCFAYLGYREGDLPVSEKAATEVLALPIFPELTEDEQAFVVQKIAEFYS